MVLIQPPPPRQRPNPVRKVLPAGTVVRRVFDPTSYGSTATSFRYWGPSLRFDHHEGDPAPEVPALSRRRAIYYGGFDLSCCIVEVFGDTGIIDCGDLAVAEVILTRAVTLLDLRGPGAMRAGSIAALAKVADRSVSQAWARYFYEQPGTYGLIDGILFLNAHNDEEALALVERAANAIQLQQVLRLDDPSLRPLLLRIAAENNLVLM